MNSEEIKNQIKKLQEELKVAELAEHKVDLVSVVKQRIKESSNEITPAAIEYILNPIRIYLCGKAKVKRGPYCSWSNDEMEMLIKGRHDELIKKGYSMKKINNKATHMGYKFRYNKPLVKKEGK